MAKRRYVNKTVTPRQGGKLLAVPSDDVANIANYTRKLNFRRDSDGELRREGWEAFRPTSDTLPASVPTDRIGERAYAPIRKLHQFSDGNGYGKLVCASDGSLYSFDYNASWLYVFEGYIDQEDATDGQYVDNHTTYGWSKIASGLAREPTKGLDIPDGSIVAIEILDPGDGIAFSAGGVTHNTLRVNLDLSQLIHTGSESVVVEIRDGKVVGVDIQDGGSDFTAGEYQVTEIAPSFNEVGFGAGQSLESGQTETLSYASSTSMPRFKVRVHEDNASRNWECVSVAGYAIFNNGYDLPLIYRSEWPAAVPLYGLREARVASVGTIQVYDGRLVCADIVEIAEGFELLMSSPDRYKNVYESTLNKTGNIILDRNQYSLLWSGYNNPWLFNQDVRGSMEAGDNKFKLTYPVEFNSEADGFNGLVNPIRSFKVGDPVYVVGAGYGDSDLTIDTDSLFRVKGNIERVDITNRGSEIEYTDDSGNVHKSFKVNITLPTIPGTGTDAILQGNVEEGYLTDIEVIDGGSGFATEGSTTITFGDIVDGATGAPTIGSTGSSPEITYYSSAKYAFDEQAYNELYDASTTVDKSSGEVSIDNPVRIESIEGYIHEFTLSGTTAGGIGGERFELKVNQQTIATIAPDPPSGTMSAEELAAAFGQLSIPGYTVTDTSTTDESGVVTAKVRVVVTSGAATTASITSSFGAQTQGVFVRQYPEAGPDGVDVPVNGDWYLKDHAPGVAPYHTPIYKVTDGTTDAPITFGYGLTPGGDSSTTAWFMMRGYLLVAWAYSTNSLYPPTNGWSSEYVKLEYFENFDPDHREFGTRVQLYKPDSSASSMTITGTTTHTITLNTNAVTAVDSTMMGRMVDMGLGYVFDYDLGSAYKDWVEDGSSILRMEGLENRLIVYREGGYFQMNMTGKVADPFTFQSRYSGPRVPDFRHSLVSINGQYHIYGGYTGFYMVTLGQPDPKVIPALELGERFWRSVDRAEAEYVISAQNPTTQEIFISTPDKTFSLDLLTLTLSEIDACFTAMTAIRKPVDEAGLRGAGKQEEVWFLMAQHQPDSTALSYTGTLARTDNIKGHHISRYGFGSASEDFSDGYKIYSRNGYRDTSGVLQDSQGYTSELTSGLFSFGDRFNDKNLRSYMVHVSDRVTKDPPTPIKVVVYTAYSTNGEEHIFGEEPDPVKDGFVVLSNPAVENLIPLYLRAPYFKDSITIEGKDNPIRLTGRTFEVSGIASESATQTTNQGAQDAS